MTKALCAAVVSLMLSECLPAQTTDQDRTAIYNLKKSCATEARQWLRSNSIAAPRDNPYYEYKIHYSVKLNGCFVQESNVSYDLKHSDSGPAHYQRLILVADIHSDLSVATYWMSYRPEGGRFVHDCKLPPDDKSFCKVHGLLNGAPTDANDPDITKEWLDAIKPYMDE